MKQLKLSDGRQVTFGLTWLYASPATSRKERDGQRGRIRERERQAHNMLCRQARDQGRPEPMFKGTVFPPHIGEEVTEYRQRLGAATKAMQIYDQRRARGDNTPPVRQRDWVPIALRGFIYIDGRHGEPSTIAIETIIPMSPDEENPHKTRSRKDVRLLAIQALEEGLFGTKKTEVRNAAAAELTKAILADDGSPNSDLAKQVALQKFEQVVRGVGVPMTRAEKYAIFSTLDGRAAKKMKRKPKRKYKISESVSRLKTRLNRALLTAPTTEQAEEIAVRMNNLLTIVLQASERKMPSSPPQSVQPQRPQIDSPQEPTTQQLPAATQPTKRAVLPLIATN